MRITFIDPVEDLGAALLDVEKPARYSGGEYGILAIREAMETGPLRAVIAFPDLYEIGMSNQAFRIIYNGLNRLGGVSCDRAFAPAPDFEALLAEKGMSLYGLDTGIPLGETDLLCFTLGYELGIGGVLTILQSSRIPLRAADRGEGSPIVLIGGPCISNPLPFSLFADSFWIGEAEAGFFDLASSLVEMKKNGKRRGDLLEKIRSHPSVWHRGKEKARRAVDRDFASRPADAAVFPISSMRTVQHHGAVEIMRGCPNGCRFCHAGIWYRPMRQKSAAVVRAETAAFIEKGGYREISLSSLSTGDYRGIDSLTASLAASYGKDRISFQLPSLKVSTFSLALLGSVSEVRKSGLTFAVETPLDAWQLAINKEVSLESVVSIIREAKKQGWRGAKFYFMIGLPVGEDAGLPVGEDADLPVEEGAENGSSEEEAIAGFVLEVSRRTSMHFSVNVGTFIPKSHTPYQWAAQLDRNRALKKLEYIKNTLKPRGFKVNFHDPLVSTIEGIFSRCGERAGEMALAAFSQGARLDAWSEYFRRDIWEGLLEGDYADLASEIEQERSIDEGLPWDCVESGASKSFFKKEWEKSIIREITSPCIENCTNPCGNCIPEHGIVSNIIQSDNLPYVTDNAPVPAPVPDSATTRLLFRFSKTGKAVFLSHLSLAEVFSMAFVRSGLSVQYSRGFNPLPRLDIASPLSLGIAALGEIASVDTESLIDGKCFMETLSRSLPEGIRITEAEAFIIPPGTKKHPVSALLWGAVYDGVSVPRLEEKAFRESRGGRWGLVRQDVLADNSLLSGQKPGTSGTDYFDLYRKLYPK